MQTEGVCRISIDGEMLGGVVRHYSMIELGACTIEACPRITFSGIIRPTLDANEPYEHGARKVLRRPFQDYYTKGQDPRDVAHAFIEFCDSVRNGRKIELHGVNIAFDFAFFREFLYRYSPDRYEVIGHKGYDITSFGCGVFQVPLGSMSAQKLWNLIKTFPDVHAKYYPGELCHSAIEDAIDQAKLLLALEEVQRLKQNSA